MVQMWVQICIFAPAINSMATVKAFIRTSSSRKDLYVSLRFRLRDGIKRQLFYTSEVQLNPEWWDSKRERVKIMAPCPKEERERIDESVLQYKKLLYKVYANADHNNLDSKTFAELIEEELHPEQHEKVEYIWDIFDGYMKEVKPSESYCKSVRLVRSCLQRFEIYTQIEAKKKYLITFNSFTDTELGRFAEFLSIEHTLFDVEGKPLKKYAPIYNKVLSETRMRVPKERGRNSISKMLKVFRSVWNWAIRHQMTDNYPFGLFDMPSQTYGTPYYITIEERNLIADYDLSDNPRLAVQRDIFIFQCLIGCRVSDLYGFTPANVIGDTIQYIARKTAREKPRTIIVPLNSRAKEILSRYYDGIRTEGKLFPFVKEQKYNVRIKQIFRQCGITRKVAIYNSKTGKEEIRPICDIASSHLARRTFVGNLYKKVGNVDLVASLSGHASNSAAFFRYRDIDLETKQELVDKIE